jgi:transposase
VDMRMSFRGLAGMVRDRLRDDPLSGHLFCFLNARRTMMKCLLYDRTGFWIFHKRLSSGTFEMPTVSPGSGRVRIDACQLAMLLDGVDLGAARRKRIHRYADAIAES